MYTVPTQINNKNIPTLVSFNENYLFEPEKVIYQKKLHLV